MSISFVRLVTWTCVKYENRIYRSECVKGKARKESQNEIATVVPKLLVL